MCDPRIVLAQSPDKTDAVWLLHAVNDPAEHAAFMLDREMWLGTAPRSDVPSLQEKVGIPTVPPGGN